MTKKDISKVFIEVKLLRLKSIKENPNNPNVMDKETYDGLVASMKNRGWLLDPPVIRAFEDGTYRAISGHHRIRAGIEAGIIETYCKVLSNIDDKTESILLIEANKRRGELDTGLLNSFVDYIMIEHEIDFEDLMLSVGFDESDVVSMGFTDYDVEMPDDESDKDEKKYIDFKCGEIKGKIDISVYNQFVNIMSQFEKYKIFNDRIKDILTAWKK